MYVRVSEGVVVRVELERWSAVVVVRVVHADTVAVVYIAAEPLQLAAGSTSPASQSTAHLHLYLLNLTY